MAMAACWPAPHAEGFPFPPHRNAPRPLLVGYFTNSGLHSPTPFYVKSLMTSGSAGRLDQINYSSASVRNGRCSLSDPGADLFTAYSAGNSVDGAADNPASPFRGYFHQFQELKRRFPKLKLLISLEGRASDFAFDAQPENRAAFVSSCVEMYLRGHFAEGITEPGLFDGFDIDWESPHEADAANFAALLAEFRRQMNAAHRGLLLSVAVDQSPSMLPGTDFAELAPLFSSPSLRSASISGSIASYRARGIPVRKLLMGLPFYGYGWTAVPAANHGLLEPGHALRGDRPYHFIRTLAQPSWVFRDPRSRAPWIFDGQNFWTYEDPVSIRYKASFAARQHLGGVMIWDLSGDTARAELLRSAYRALHHPLRAKDFPRTRVAPPRNAATVAQR